MQSAKWKTIAQFGITNIPKQYRQWLLDPKSLTELLVTKSAGDFRVQVLREGWGQATLEETTALNLIPRHLCWVREVSLMGKRQDWVFARSIIPFNAMQGATRQLTQLKSKPLGRFLFKHPLIQRQQIQIDKCVPEGPQYRGKPNTAIWGRRSVFRIKQRRLLVSEYFLPALVNAP